MSDIFDIFKVFKYVNEAINGLLSKPSFASIFICVVTTKLFSDNPVVILFWTCLLIDIPFEISALIIGGFNEGANNNISRKLSSSIIAHVGRIIYNLGYYMVWILIIIYTIKIIAPPDSLAPYISSLNIFVIEINNILGRVINMNYITGFIAKLNACLDIFLNYIMQLIQRNK
jgi:hypothetical protein